MQMHTLKFTREFTKGTLVGLKQEDTITMSNPDYVEDYVNCINDNNADGVLEYKIIQYELVN